MSDELLLQKIAEGNEDCITELYQRYSSVMYRYFLRMFNSQQATAEDFTHELFIKVMQSAGTFKQDKKASTWLYSIAANLCKNEWRNNTNRRNILSKIETEKIVEPIEGTRTDNLKIKNDIDSTLDSLDPDDKELILFRFQQEFSIKEIAAILNIPEGTVKSRIFYLMKKMSVQLKDFSEHLQN